MVFTLACPENSAYMYGNMMRTALCTMLKDPGFSVLTSDKEAQICASDMLELKLKFVHLIRWNLHKVVSPIFYQYITDEMFKQLVKQQYKLPATTMEVCSLPPLDYQEQNAVQYAQDTLSDICVSVRKGGLIN